MNSPDFEPYHKRKHLLQELIDNKRKDEKSKQSASDANSQLMALESFMQQQFNAIIDHATNQAYHIYEMLESTTDSDTTIPHRQKN